MVLRADLRDRAVEEEVFGLQFSPGDEGLGLQTAIEPSIKDGVGGDSNAEVLIPLQAAKSVLSVVSYMVYQHTLGLVARLEADWERVGITSRSRWS